MRRAIYFLLLLGGISFPSLANSTDYPTLEKQALPVLKNFVLINEQGYLPGSEVPELGLLLEIRLEEKKLRFAICSALHLTANTALTAGICVAKFQRPHEESEVAHYVLFTDANYQVHWARVRAVSGYLSRLDDPVLLHFNTGAVDSWATVNPQQKKDFAKEFEKGATGQMWGYHSLARHPLARKYPGRRGGVLMMKPCVLSRDEPEIHWQAIPKTGRGDEIEPKYPAPQNIYIEEVDRFPSASAGGAVTINRSQFVGLFLFSFPGEEWWTEIRTKRANYFGYYQGAKGKVPLQRDRHRPSYGIGHALMHIHQKYSSNIDYPPP